MSQMRITIQDLRSLRSVASQNGTLERWSDIALQFAEEAVQEIRVLRERIDVDGYVYAEPPETPRLGLFPRLGDGGQSL
jgi:hypothetical protein